MGKQFQGEEISYWIQQTLPKTKCVDTYIWVSWIPLDTQASEWFLNLTEMSKKKYYSFNTGNCTFTYYKS